MMDLPTIVVSTFPPLRCGIARYADQHVQWLRRNGIRVLTVGPPDCNADEIHVLCGGTHILAITDCALKHDFDINSSRLSVHWHDDHYFAGGFTERIPTALAFRRLFRSFGEVELICHETYVPEAVSTLPRRILRALYRYVRRKAWLDATTLVFHSEAERRKAEQAHGGSFPDRKVVIRDHTTFLFKYRDVDQATARRELGIPTECVLFLCIGFLSPHKGFHLAMEAFTCLKSSLARLAVVGSIREQAAELEEYVGYLRQLARKDERIVFVNEFVSDDAYDTWNAAADVVVVPYLEAFSSSVVARAKLFGKRVIASDVGGIADQLSREDRLYRTPQELVGIMRSFVAPLNG